MWGRNTKKAEAYKKEMATEGYTVIVAPSPEEVAKNCNLIITTTSARTPLLKAESILPGTHITAMGADAPGKIELDPYIIQKADKVIVDSKTQCIDHGEITQAFKKGFIKEEDLLELGEVIATPNLGRTINKHITIADLTGVGVQDIQIAKAVLDF